MIFCGFIGVVGVVQRAARSRIVAESTPHACAAALVEVANDTSSCTARHNHASPVSFASSLEVKGRTSGARASQAPKEMMLVDENASMTEQKVMKCLQIATILAI